MKKIISIFVSIILFIAYSYIAYAQLLPPKWVVGIETGSFIMLKWDSPKTSVKTIIYRKKQGEESGFKEIKTVEKEDYFYDYDRSSGIYIYQLKAIDAEDNESDFSEKRVVASTGDITAKCASPPMWDESFSTEKSILLQWEYLCETSVKYYNLYKKDEGEDSFSLYQSNIKKQIYRDEKISAGQKISYKICPVDKAGNQQDCSLPIVLVAVKPTSLGKDGKMAEIEPDFTIRPTSIHRFIRFGAAGSFISPTDINVDRNGNVYIADTGSGLIHTFNELGNYESSIGNFENLLGIDVDKNGIIYGVDSYKGIVKAYDQEGMNVFKIDLPKEFAKRKEYNFKKYGLVDVSVDDETGLIYIVDNYNNHVYKFDKESKLHGVFLEKGLEEGKIYFPTFSYIDKLGNFILADTMNQRISIFNSKKMEPMIIFGRAGNKLGTFIRPKGVACDKNGNIFVADSFTNSIQVFSPEGDFKYILGDGLGSPLDIVAPNGIFVDNNDKVYVVEKLINRIQVRQLLSENKIIIKE
jgi:DNA-binding beta-propeller fold protein YncE